MTTINIANDFSDVPGGRFQSDGSFSGEDFRDRFLAPALKQNNEVQVVLDGTEGFGSSFLEEAFGGLVRKYDFSEAVLLQHLKLIAVSPAAQRYKRLALKFITDAIQAKKSKSVPRPGK